jgi:hydrophobic/amphiphilic exporter-1 (mainly G- bacteria), HAE1 family
VAKSSTAIVLAAAFYAEKGAYSDAFVSNYVDLYVTNAIKRIKGVGDVVIFNERKYAMRLWLDPVKLAARKLTAGDVVRSLREQNLAVPAGQIGSEPALPGQAIEISLRAEGRLRDADEFGRMIVKTEADGTLVLLRDVGRAEIGAEDYSSILRYNGVQSVGLGIFQLPNANALDVQREARAVLAELATKFPPGMSYQIGFDPTSAVRESITEVVVTLAEAIALVIIVIFIFLQGWRATIIPAITIPVSLVGTFIFVKAFGFSINTLTLFGLTLATGLVVDDAIVVLENIERHIAEHGRSAREAASSATREVAGAVIATSLVLIAVFVPVALFPGTTGRIYLQFSLTIAFSIALSAFNALTLTPALSALLLRPVDPRERFFFFRAVEHALGWFTRVYQRLLRGVLRHKLIATAAFVVGLAGTVYVYQRVPTAFVPEEDQGYVMFVVQLPSGSSLQETLRVTKQVEEMARKIPEVSGVFNVNGFSFTGNASNKAMIFVTLDPIDERREPGQSAAAVLERLRGPVSGIRDAFVIPFLPPALQGVGSLGGFQLQVIDRAGGPIEELAGAAWGLVGAAAGDRRLAGVFTPFTVDNPQLLIEIDRQRAKALAVSFDEIASTLQIYMGSSYVNDFDFNNRSYRVYAQADRQFRSEPRDIRQFYVRSQRGEMIPLDSLVRLVPGAAPQTISHFNTFRAAELTGAAAPGVSSGQAMEAMEELAGKLLPAGFAHEWSGESLEQSESSGQTLFILALAVLVVYLVLAAQYESFALPFIILLAVPVAILGALLLQSARGLQNDVFAQIGIVMLVGLASKNAILIVEFAESLREHGRSVVDAAVEAARIRLRPILMTSLAFIIGVLPLVFASGAGQNARHSLGTTVFGGMIASTFLNLFFIPVLYVLLQTWRERRRRVHVTA